MWLINLISSPRAFLALSLVMALAASHTWTYRAGGRAVQAAWDASTITREQATLKAINAAHAQELAVNEKLRKANDAYQLEKKRRAADAAAADAGLRQFQATLDSHPGAGDPAASRGVDGTGGVEREILGECATALVALGKEAGRLADKSIGLQAYILAIQPPK